MAAIVVTDSDFEYIDGLRTKMYEGLDAYEAGKDLAVVKICFFTGKFLILRLTDRIQIYGFSIF